MRKLFYLILFLFGSYQLQAQSLQIKGQLHDSTSNTNIINASVILLQAKDSILVAHTRSNNEGNFTFSKLPSGKYVLAVLYPSYVDRTKEVNLTSDQKNIKINMFRKEILLQEVIVKSSPIRMKGDTTEYDASAFKVQPNANVEDLLKQLPSIQVDQNGNITAQGQKVKHVYVDGEEFFGDDPTLVTKNLRADIVDKVQVYDKKSDAAAFTGVDDGSREKTVNLTIKKDKKFGHFGRVEGGIGNKGFYYGQGMFNEFKGERKFSAYLTQANTGISGLSSNDQAKIGVGNGNPNNSNYNGKGLPTITNGGLHYDNKWNDKKTELNANYNLNRIAVEGNESTISQNNLAAGVQFQNTSSYFDNKSLKNNIDAKLIQNIDSTSKIIIYADGDLNTADNFSSGENTLRLQDQTLLYNQKNSVKQTLNNKNANINADWMKSFKKKGRSLTVYLHQNFIDNSGDGLSLSSTDFFNPQTNTSTNQVLNLKKTQSTTNAQTTFNTNYTEPLTDRWTMALIYQLNNNDGKDQLLSYNQNTQNNTNILDNNFSTDFKTQQLKNQGGLLFLYNHKNLNFNFGTNIADAKLKMINVLQNNTELNRNFTTFNPVVNVTYSKLQNLQFRLNYNGTSVLPTNQQLQPFLYNNNQVVTYNSNTNLQTSFDHTLNLNFFKMINVLKLQYFGVYAAANQTSNPIVLALTNDPSGRYIYQYQNLSSRNNTTLNYGLFYGSRIKPLWDIQTNHVLSITNITSYSLVNQEINQLRADVYAYQLSLNKELPQKISFGVENTVSYNTNVSSLQKQFNNNYWSNTLEGNATVYFLKNFEVNSSVGYLWQQQSASFPTSFNRLIWNAYVGRSFGKNKDFLFKLSAHDLLNQNTGFSRAAAQGNISQNTFTTIRRYFMASLVWNFNNFGGVKK